MGGAEFSGKYDGNTFSKLFKSDLGTSIFNVNISHSKSKILLSRQPGIIFNCVKKGFLQEIITMAKYS